MSLGTPNSRTWYRPIAAAQHSLWLKLLKLARENATLIALDTVNSTFTIIDMNAYKYTKQHE